MPLFKTATHLGHRDFPHLGLTHTSATAVKSLILLAEKTHTHQSFEICKAHSCNV